MMRLTRIAATADERRRTLPGDGLLNEAIGTWTHAVTIAAPPQAVWPWLAQMGVGRAGWYSWDVIDNGGQRSAEEIVPGWQRINVGDVLPAAPGANDAFVVERLEVGRDLVLAVPYDRGGLRGTWEFLLDPLPGEQTRLLVRSRVGPRGWRTPLSAVKRPIDLIYWLLGRMPRRLMLALARAGHRPMQARQLRGIRRRAESDRAPPVAPERALVGPGVGVDPLRSRHHYTPAMAMKNRWGDVHELLSQKGMDLSLDELESLKVLDLYKKGVNDEDLKILSALENLEFLSLASTRVSDDGVRQLGALTRLKELHLDNTAISDEGLPDVARLKTLETLDLKGTRVTDDGLTLLAPLVNLKNLYLADTTISDLGLRHLKAFPELEMLILWNDRISDEGLSNLHESRKLKRIVLWGTNVTRDGVESLLEQVQGCDIDYDAA